MREKLKVVTIALGAALSLAGSLDASASTVSLYDGTFNNLTFVQSNASRAYGFGPSSAAINASVINDNVDNLRPDPNAIKIGFSWTSPTGTGNAGLGVMDNALSYNPQTMGAIASLDLSINKMFPSSNAIGTPVRFLLEQAGQYYVYVTPTQTSTGGQYTNYTSTALLGSDFTHICLINCGAGNYTMSLPGQPDFSGPAITFGLLSTTGNGQNALVFFDNYDVTINQVAAVPEPSTWAMMLLGFAGVGFMAYRRKAKPASMAAMI